MPDLPCELVEGLHERPHPVHIGVGPPVPRQLEQTAARTRVRHAQQTQLCFIVSHTRRALEGDTAWGRLE